MHSDLDCKVGDHTCAHIKYEVLLCIQICEHFHESARGTLAKGAKNCTMSVLKGHLSGINPNMIIGWVNKSAPPPVISLERTYQRPALAQPVLDQLECQVCLDIITQAMV